MHKVSVYVSWELGDGLKRLGVPVSSVCERALHDTVAKLEAMQRMVDQEAIRAGARRLWSSGGESESNAETEGYDCGLRWAVKLAEEPELRALAEFSHTPWVNLRVTSSEWPTLFDELVDLDGRPLEDEMIWGREPFIVGFVRGALDGYWAMAAEGMRHDNSAVDAVPGDHVAEPPSGPPRAVTTPGTANDTVTNGVAVGDRPLT